MAIALNSSWTWKWTAWMQWSPVPATAVSSASDYPDFIPLQVIDAFQQLRVRLGRHLQAGCVLDAMMVT
jgi:hypothetical protein